MYSSRFLGRITCVANCVPIFVQTIFSGAGGLKKQPLYSYRFKIMYSITHFQCHAKLILKDRVTIFAHGYFL